MRNSKAKNLFILLLAVGASTAFILSMANAFPPSTTVTLQPPTLGCGESGQAWINILVCGAYPNGAPLGFSLHWTALPDVDGDNDIDAADCAAFVWPSDDALYCKGSFSGRPEYNGVEGCDDYRILQNPDGDPCVPANAFTVQAGQLNDDACGVSYSDGCGGELDCGTTYVFRAFAHAGVINSIKYRKSGFTANFCCSTNSCPQGDQCVYTQGYWQNHPNDRASTLTGGVGPGRCDGNNGLYIGTGASSPAGSCTTPSGLNSCYDNSALGAILARSNSQGCPAANALMNLGHQYIAARLNLLNGANDCVVNVPTSGAKVSDLLAAADGLIGSRCLVDGCLVKMTGPGGNTHPDTILWNTMVAYGKVLDDYNNGRIPGCPLHCGDQSTVAPGPIDVEPVSAPALRK